MLSEIDVNILAVPGLLEPGEQGARALEDPANGIGRSEQARERTVVGELPLELIE